MLFRSRWKPIVVTFRPAIFDSDVLPFDIANLTQSLAECVDSGRRFTWRSATEKSDDRHRRLLRARRERPHRRRAAEQRDELAPFYLIELHSISNSPRQMQDIELAMVSQRVYDHALARARAR